MQAIKRCSSYANPQQQIIEHIDDNVKHISFCNMATTATDDHDKQLVLWLAQLSFRFSLEFRFHNIIMNE